MKSMQCWLYLEGNNIVHSSAVISENVHIGKNNVIYPYAVLGAHGFIRESRQFEGKIIIGDNNQIGCHTSIMVGVSGVTIIGDGNMIMNYVNIGHDVTIGHVNEIGVGTIIGGWTVIGNENKIKIGCTIRNRIKIGNKCIVGMGSNVVKDVPDGVKVIGNPAR